MNKQNINEMNQELLTLIKECNKKKWGDEFPITDASSLLETITESKYIYSEKIGEHRWYDDMLYVVELGGHYFGYHGYYITDDACISDMCLEYDINTIKEMKPKEIVKVVYVEK